MALIVRGACIPVDIKVYVVVPIGLALIVRGACVPVDIKAYEIVPIGLALIVCKLVSVLILKPMRSCSCVALIKSRVVPGLIRVWKQF